MSTVSSYVCQLLAVLGAAACAAQPGSPPAATPVPVPAGVPPALAPFLGEHRGSLRMFGDTAVREVPMGLTVAPLPDEPGRLRWALHYGDGAAAQIRDYRLETVDAATGRYRIDERNGIVLDARLVDDELVSVFAAGGQTLVVRYRAGPDGVQFALESFAADAAVPAGTAGDGAETAMAVTSWPDFARQRALLRRVPAAP